MIQTPAAELADLAAECIGFDRTSRFKPEAARHATRDMLTERAQELGIPAAEIEAAVNAAIGGATAST